MADSALLASGMLSDLQYVLRSLARARGFSAVAIITLALGIGSATAIYSAVHYWAFFAAARFPRDLLILGAQTKNSRFTPMSAAAHAMAYRELNDIFAETAFARTDTVNVVVDGEPVASSVISVSPNFLSLIGANPVQGRGFLPGEEVAGHDEVIVVSDEFRREAFPDGGDAIGRKIIVDDKVCTVVGVLAPRQAQVPFLYAGIVRPFELRPDAAAAWQNWLIVFGRLSSGVSPATAEQAMTAAKTQPPPPARMQSFLADWRPQVSTMQEAVANFSSGRNHWILIAAVAFLYAIGCLNATNLMLVRMLGRRREFSIRLALGASRFQLIRLLLLEAFTLAATAGALGILVANWLVPLLLTLAQSRNSFDWSRWSLDRPTVIVLVSLTLVTALLVALVPALRMARANAQEGLKEGGAALGESRGLARMRSGFVILQAAFALILLAGAGLMVRTVARLQAVSLGFETHQRMKASLSFPAGHVPGKEERHALLQQLQARLVRVPGVVAASYGTDTLLPGYFFGSVTLEPPHSDPIQVKVDYVSADFLQTSGMRLVRGRLPPQTGGEIMINEALAKKYFGDEDPIGRSLHKKADGGSKEGDWQIVGIVNDVRYTVREAPGFHVYAPETWWPPSINTFILQVARDPDKVMAAAIKRAIYDFDRKIVVSRIHSLDEIRGWSDGLENYLSAVLKVLSGIALTLAAVGMFSVLAYTVDQRRGEFGVRLALGATPRNLVRLVLRRGVTLALAGVVIGVATSLLLVRYLQSLLYETPPHDPVVLVGVSVILLAAAVLACLLPARRAGMVDVARLLRSE